jgi:hypothetical protein
MTKSHLKRLGDRAEIRDCLTRCARGVDRLDRDLVLSAYHPNAMDDHGMFVGSREEFVDWAFELHRTHHRSHHHYLLNHSCDLAGEEAHAETYFVFVAVKSAPPLTVTASGGRYIDRLTKREGAWRIATRVVVRDWVVEHPVSSGEGSATAVMDALTGGALALLASSPKSARDRTDLSYARPLHVQAARLEG